MTAAQLTQTVNGVTWVPPVNQPCITGGAMSNCVNTIWNVQATATGGDGAMATVYEGIAIRMNLQTANALCP